MTDTWGQITISTLIILAILYFIIRDAVCNGINRSNLMYLVKIPDKEPPQIPAPTLTPPPTPKPAPNEMEMIHRRIQELNKR